MSKMAKDKEEGEKLKAAVQLETSEQAPCVKKVKATISAASVGEELKASLAEFAKYAQIPGFRPGKAPIGLVKGRYDDKIREEARRKALYAVFEKASESLSDVVSYNFEKEEDIPELKDGSDFSVSMVFNVAPEIDVAGYKDIKVKESEIKVEDSEVEAELKRLRELYGKFEKVETPAEKDDMLKISFTSDCQEPDKIPEKAKFLVKSDETWAWLREPEMLPGIIKALTGAVPGGTYELAAEFPGDFREKDLAGRKINYSIKVVENQRRVPVQSDDELCKLLKVEDIGKLNEGIRMNLEHGAKQKLMSGYRNQVIDELCAKAGDFPIPPSLLADSTKKELLKIANSMIKKQSDLELFEKERDNYMKVAEKNAQKRLRVFFVMRKIAQLENIAVGDEEMDAVLNGLSSHYGMKKSDIYKRLSSSGEIEDMKMDVLISKVVDTILNGSKDAAAVK